jgi:hypothetical protein
MVRWKTPRKNKYKAKAIVVDGVRFASQLERYCYERLVMEKVLFKFQESYIIQPPFERADGSKVRAIKIVVDFVFTTDNGIILLDTKGFFTEYAKMKYKMLEYMFTEMDYVYELFFLSKRDAIDNFIIYLKTKMK